MYPYVGYIVYKWVFIPAHLLEVRINLEATKRESGALKRRLNRQNDYFLDECFR